MRATQLRQGLVLGLLFLLVCWLAWLIWGLASKAQIAIRQAHQAQAEYRELEERRAHLEARIAALKTPRGQEAAMRTAFGVARPGEEVIVVVPPQVASTTPERSWWEKVLDWF